MNQQLKRLGKRIIFVRHGESIGNALGLDDNSLTNLPNHRFPLTDLGRGQAHRVGEELKSRQITWQATFHSTYLRTQETLKEIMTVNDAINCPIIMDPRLDEWWRGIWHTMSKEDVALLYPKEGEIQKREGWYHYRAPGGQSGPDVELQIRSFLFDFCFGCYSNCQDILISGHGKWAILLYRLILGLSIDEAKQRLQSTPFANCSLTIFDGSFNYLEF